MKTFLKLLFLNWIWKSLMCKGNIWAIHFSFSPTQKPHWYFMDCPWKERRGGVDERAADAGQRRKTKHVLMRHISWCHEVESFLSHTLELNLFVGFSDKQVEHVSPVFPAFCPAQLTLSPVTVHYMASFFSLQMFGPPGESHAPFD